MEIYQLPKIDDDVIYVKRMIFDELDKIQYWNKLSQGENAKKLLAYDEYEYYIIKKYNKYHD